MAIWNNADKTGKIVDAAGLIYNVGLKNLDPSVDGVLFPGETVEGILIDFETVVSVASITAPDPEHSRAADFKAFEARYYAPSATSGKPRRSRLAPDAPDPGERKEFEGGGTRGVGGSHTA